MSTGLHPLHWLAADKATPRKGPCSVTQCIILIAPAQRKKTVYPVSAPLVYSQASSSEPVADLAAKDHISQSDQLLEECIELGEEEELSAIFDTSAYDDGSNMCGNNNNVPSIGTGLGFFPRASALLSF